MISDTNVPSPEKTTTLSASRILQYAAATWLTVATVGQWIFGFYILSFYGKSAFAGEFEKWNQVLPHGYVTGDWKGNLVVGIHVLLASVLVIGGPLQLVPQIRRHFPLFHRWLGRIYVTIAIAVAAAGLGMIWTRGGVGDETQRISISIQAIYIIAFAWIVIRYARLCQFEMHRIWALRLFMGVNGVWFFRIGLMFWLVVNGGPAGFDPETFTGPFLTFLSIFTYAVPFSLIVLEMYLYAGKSRSRLLMIISTVVILVFTLITAIGVFGATMGMWLPRIG